MTGDAPVALVVGGSGDIGKAIASRLGAAGYRIAITGRDAERVGRTAAELAQAGVTVRGFACDLADATTIERLFAEIGAAFARLDVVVNAAGVAELRSLRQADAQHFLGTLQVNLVGPALVARHALALMRKARAGAIINITSSAGHEGRKGFGAYSASKGGLIALSEALREEAARYGVRVATICPDRVDTRMHGDDPGRATMIQTADLAEAVVFLLRLSPTAVVRELRIYTADG